MSIATVQDLLEALADLDLHPDTRIRWASQPSWPFEYAIASAELVEPDPADDDDGQGGDDGDGLPTLYLVEGAQLRYLPPAVAEQIGWGR